MVEVQARRGRADHLIVSALEFALARAQEGARLPSYLVEALERFSARIDRAADVVRIVNAVEAAVAAGHKANRRDAYSMVAKAENKRASSAKDTLSAASIERIYLANRAGAAALPNSGKPRVIRK